MATLLLGANDGWLEVYLGACDERVQLSDQAPSL